MIYLIGGPPRCGKSTLARLVAKRKSVPYISADDIASLIIPYIPEAELPKRFPLREIRTESNFSNDICYSKYSTEQIVTCYLQQAETLWPGLGSFINYVLRDHHDFVLDGWQLLPHLIQTLVSPENSSDMKVCFLWKSDVDKILNRIKTGQAKNDWVINNTREEETFLQIAKMIRQFGDHIQKEAAQFGFTTVDTDDHFREKIESLSESL